MTADRNFSTHAQVRRLTVCAMLTAIIWLLTVSPIGFTLPFFGISMTFNHIPMIIGTLMEGLGVGCVLAAMFGLSSLYTAFARPTYYSPLFQNPLVSVLPRLLTAPVTYFVYKGVKKLCPGKPVIAWGAAAIAGTLANTLFTLGAMALYVRVNPGALGLEPEAVGGAVAVIWGLSINSPFECISSVILSTAVMGALSRYTRGRRA
ncbi:MAG TPA: ECF transporter S component [Candidatus Fimadaptatus faecigallinarum]|uniref:ECF transporter S component n=1 Tax=Candidatus Fimadaptatus faecigallinarum TaxID=2840814 RepID=A0A9D1LS19_9FIRM|nr:ECF transporter S component [Candidatus Fimadaptatus faecigallinarum]